MTTTNHNGRYRIPVLVLLTLALCCGAFAASRGRNLAERTGTEESSQAAPADSPPVSLYGDSGLWGLRSASGRMLIEPEWYSLRMMSDSVLIARRGGGEKPEGQQQQSKPAQPKPEQPKPKAEGGRPGGKRQRPQGAPKIAKDASARSAQGAPKPAAEGEKKPNARKRRRRGGGGDKPGAAPAAE